MQNKQIEELKNNPQQQKMLDAYMKELDGAIKRALPIYAKLIQADMSKFIAKNAAKDGVNVADMGKTVVAINDMMTQVCKDLDKQISEKVRAMRDETCAGK